MRVYAATACTNHQTKTLAGVGYPRLLLSFAYDKKSSYRDRLAKNGIDLAATDVVLDSGAFTVWASGGEVDIDEFIVWAKDWLVHAPHARAINLDVIPGDHGGAPPTTRQRNAAVKKSESNADKIRGDGVPVMEVYHQHEPLSVLERLIERRTEGMPVGIGGVAGPGSQIDKRTFVDGVFQRVKDLAGGWDGIAPLHGLGIAPESPLGRRYPWSSVDANSWVYPHRMGQPVSRGGRRGKTASDSRTRNEDVAAVYMSRVLKRWVRLEAEMTRVWQLRGVRLLD